MNFLCLSDFHGTVPFQIKEIVKESKIDAILYTGDYSPHGWGEGEGENTETPLNFLVGLGLPVFSVYGNIDPDISFFEEFERENKNFHFVHLKRLKAGGYYIVGIGDYLFPNRERAINSFESLLKKKPEKTIVLSHYPPKGVLDMTDTGENAGKKELKELIDKYRPLLFLCGHIHEAAGVSKIGRTTVINAAMKTVLAEIEDGEVNVSLV